MRPQAYTLASLSSMRRADSSGIAGIVGVRRVDGGSGRWRCLLFLNAHSGQVLALAIVLGMAGCVESLGSGPRGRGQKYLERHEWAVQRFEDTPDVEVIYLGDSILSLWQHPPGPEGKTVNLAIGGDQIEHVLWRLQDARLASEGPWIVVLEVGTNNLGVANQSPTDTALGVRAVVQRVTEVWPRARVVVLSLLPREGAVDEQVQATNALLRSVDERADVSFLDLDEVFRSSATGAPRRDYFVDGLHPSELGYAEIAMWLQAAGVFMGLQVTPE